jgi:rRNA maturation endonuclease Nob1
MGVFNTAGNSSAASDPEGSAYICLACDTRYDLQYHVCPTCGSYDIRSVKWIDS